MTYYTMKKRNYSWLNPLVLVAGTIVLGSQQVQSGMVMNSADDGPGSLRYVIAHAGFNESIEFGGTSIGTPINLTSGEIIIVSNPAKPCCYHQMDRLMIL